MSEPEVDSRRWRRGFAISLLLAAATIAVYAPLRGHDFVTYDDPAYVAENPMTGAGLSWKGARWAFKTGLTGNWHPLTWLSHMLDCQIFGLDPSAHHLMSLALHAANALLLFWILVRLTGAAATSALAASLFALHPLAVESVAWVAQRKTVLSGLFFFLALAAYGDPLAPRSRGRRLLVAVLFALGLMAKPMVIVLPLLLLALDRWPLPRSGIARREESLRVPGPTGGAVGPAVGGAGAVALHLSVREKLPLFFMAMVSAVVTVAFQHRAGATASWEAIPLLDRLGNAIVSCAAYLGQMIWPRDLAVLYPHPGGVSWAAVLASGAFLAAAGAGVLAGRRRHPYLATGASWYLVTLLPTLGLVQVGYQSRADRYTYLPLIGIAMIAAWGLADVASRRRWLRAAAPVLAIAALCALALATRAQIAHWRDSESLYRQALRVTSDNAVIHYNLADLLAARGEEGAAIEHYRETIRIEPEFVEARINLGNALRRQGRLREAASSYREALRYEPESALARNNLGLALADLGEAEAALAELREAVRLDTGYPSARRNLGRALAARGESEAAWRELTRALQLDPALVEARYDMARLLEAEDRLAEAAAHYGRYLEARPEDAKAQFGLALLLERLGRPEEAVARFEAARKAAPEIPRFALRLALALYGLGREDEAVEPFCEALREQPALAAEARSNQAAGSPASGRPAPAEVLGRRCEPPLPASPEREPEIVLP